MTPCRFPESKMGIFSYFSAKDLVHRMMNNTEKGQVGEDFVTDMIDTLETELKRIGWKLKGGVPIPTQNDSFA